MSPKRTSTQRAVIHAVDGQVGLLGLTVDEAYGGANLDAVAVCIVHEELSASDPGFALAYLAHSMLFVNNLAFNGDDAQKERILPKVCWVSGSARWRCRSQMGTDARHEHQRGQQGDGTWLLNSRKMDLNGVLMKRARPLTWCGSTPGPAKTTGVACR